MPETNTGRRIFTLQEVGASIRNCIAAHYKAPIWIKAELIKLNHYASSGHCYPDLAEKKDGKLIAQMRSVIWKSDYEYINKRFLEILKEPLQNGINILFCAHLKYDPVYGMSLHIIDIDPSYSLGELEREKQATINKLKSEGLYYQNKSLALPLIPKKLAIISVQTSKGYGDYISKTRNNPWNYHIGHKLFVALLQGDKAVNDISLQLRNIKKEIEQYDAVAIIRGGGGDVGLTCYNHYKLCKEICEFPIPVLTGIGHVTNETVAEMVAYKSFITPTDLADFLLQQYHQFALSLESIQKTISHATTTILNHERSELDYLSKQVAISTKNIIRSWTQSLDHCTLNLKKSSGDLLRLHQKKIPECRSQLERSSLLYMERQGHKLTLLEQKISSSDPINILKKGFTITKAGDKIIRNIDDVPDKATITTITHDGEINSIVIRKTTHHE